MMTLHANHPKLTSGARQGLFMLQVQGNPKTLCNGLTRRDLLTAGAALGLTLPAFLRAEPASAERKPDARQETRTSAGRSRASCCSSTARRASSNWPT